MSWLAKEGGTCQRRSQKSPSHRETPHEQLTDTKDSAWTTIISSRLELTAAELKIALEYAAQDSHFARLLMLLDVMGSAPSEESPQGT